MYTWTVASATWQIQHGGPTHKTLSAIKWLKEKIDVIPVVVASELLDALVESRGLHHLGEMLAPLPDDTETVASVE